MESPIPDTPIVQEFRRRYPKWELILQRADRRINRPPNAQFEYNYLHVFIFDPIGSIHLRFGMEITGEIESAEQAAVEKALRRFIQAYPQETPMDSQL